jgi:uncharacterized protein involved in exopolysaccharide biosynthesis
MNYIEEDEIDLRELFKTIWDSKTFIIITTTIITLLAGIYAFTKTPIYEVNALIEIGNYKLDSSSGSSSNNVLLNNPQELVQKLKIIFIDEFKNVKNKKSQIVSISVPKKSKVMVEVKAEGISNKLAIQEINKLLKSVQVEDQKILNDVKNRRELKIKNINEKIHIIKNEEMDFVNDKILLQKKRVINFKKQLKEINNNIKKTNTKNPALSALLIMQQRDMSSSIYDMETNILDLKNQKYSIMAAEISKLVEERHLIQSMLLPYNYKNSQIIGKILINDYPSKPKKKLIVIVAFITGLILSIFLVFFLNFIRSMKEENSN